jgi:nucleolar GTP-binding protein
MNKITRANVEVQPYPFTTKSLYVGHTDYKYLRWQVVDTPGILDHPLESRNTIEMQAITALAHLRAAVVYVSDPSEQCGHSIEEQISLFNNIKPLFANKPLLFVLNKTDIIRLEDLPDDKRACYEEVISDTNIKVLEMSTVDEVGVTSVKDEACERLMNYRVENKMRTKKVNEFMNRLHVAVPQPRDDKERLPFIPEKVLEKQRAMEVSAEKGKKKLERDIEEELGDDYILDLKKHYDLPDDYKYDVIPEIWEGHNIADYVDPDILKKLDELEKEEELREQAGFYDVSEEEDDESMAEIRELAAQIRAKKSYLKDMKGMTKSSSKPVMPRNTNARKRERSVSGLRSKMSELGVDLEDDPDAHYMRSVSRKPKRMKLEIEPKSRSRSRSMSKPRNEMGVKDETMRIKLNKGIQKTMKKKINKFARKGEGDRHIPDLKPKHLFTGRRGIGKTDRR